MASDTISKYADFTALCRRTYSEKSCADIEKALQMADDMLAGMERYDGSPFMSHGVGVASIIVSEIGLGRNSVVSALMHDPARLGLISIEAVKAEFGEECALIIKGLNNISDVDPKVSMLQADNFRELIVSYSTDPRVILIKIADRLEVMRSLAAFPETKRTKKSWETMHLYAELAHKLGLYNIKSELEDLSFKYLEPKEHEEIRRKLAESEESRKQFIEAFSEPIESKLGQHGIKFTIKSRTKSVYSIWRKMRKQNIAFEEVYDVSAIRIVIDCEPDFEKVQCWHAYSVVTDFYTPNPERMRDWISIPKSNGYESLHVTVVTAEGRWVEVQIRSSRMNDIAERGVAAHWRYKGLKQNGMSSQMWLDRLRNLLETSAELGDGGITDHFDIAASNSEIFIFTPSGDLRKLREGATVLDFAFDIHTNLGSTCVGARIGGRNVPIREVLRNGDIVEILTSKNQKPSQSWLEVVVTSKARSRIKAYLREQEAKEAALGREELERKMRNWKLNIALEEAVTVLTKHYKLRNGVELYALIASQKIPLAVARDVLARHLSGETEAVERKSTTAKSATTKNSDDYLIIDKAMQGLDYKLGRCCNPIYGDPIFGFVTINTGITIHRNDCPNAHRLKDLYPYRVLPAQWQSGRQEGVFVATVRVVADNNVGLVNQLTEVIRDLKINMRSVTFGPAAGNTADGVIEVEVSTAKMLDAVIHNILKIKGVQRAYRLNN